jgi:hypothetical protein
MDMRVESVLRETVLSSNWRYFLHSQICLICVHHNVLSCSGTLSQQMVISKTVKSDKPFVLNVCVLALNVGTLHCVFGVVIRPLLQQRYSGDIVTAVCTNWVAFIHSFIYLASVLLHLVTVDLSKFIQLQYIYFHKSVNQLQTYYISLMSSLI